MRTRYASSAHENADPRSGQGVVGGTATPESDKLFGALVTTFKKRGKTKEDLAHFIRNSDSVFKVNGMEGVTMDDAMAYLDKNW